MRFKKFISFSLAVMLICTYGFGAVSAKDNDKEKVKDENQVQVSSFNTEKDLEKDKPNQNEEGESSKSLQIANDKHNEKKEKIETGSTAQTIDADNLIWESPSDDNPFGGAINFSLFTFKDVSNFNESEGPVAVGGNVNIKTGTIAWAQGRGAQGNSIPKFNIGFLLSGNMNTTTMSNVLNGDAVVDEKNTTQQSIQKIGMHSYKTVLKRDVQSYFNTAESQLKEYNSKISALPVNGEPLKVGGNWSTLTFKGTNKDINVFELDTKTFTHNILMNRSITFDVPSSSVVVVNVKGDTTGNATIGFCVNPTVVGSTKEDLATRTIFNFDSDIKNITFKSSANIYGTVFAPYADWIVDNSGVAVDGNLIANSMNANGNPFEVHYYPFKGKIKWPTVEPTTGTIEFIKKGSDVEKLAGAIFELKNNSSGAIVEVTSAAKGVVKFDNIKQGYYTLTEKIAPDGYTKSAEVITVIVNDEGEVTYKSNDKVVNTNLLTEKYTNIKTMKTAFIEFIKKGDDGKLLQGATFTLRNKLTNTIVEAVSDDNGTVRFENLVEGKYELKEKTAPTGYIKKNATSNFTVKKDGKISGASVQGLISKFTNKKSILPNFNFIKKGNDGKLLEGATFVLKNTKKGSIPISSISDTDGKVSFTDLKKGTYTLTEQSAPTGYTKSNESVTVKVSNKGAITFKQGKNTIAPENIFQKFINNKVILNGNIQFNKYSFVIGEAVKGAKFELKTESSQHVMYALSNAQGLVNFNDIVPGSYTISEVEAPTGFIKSEASANITVYSDGTTNLQKSIANLIAVENAFRNQKLGNIEFIKYADNKQPLADAEFGIYKDGVLLGNSVLSAQTTGLVKFENIIPGTYIIKEIKAPQYYQMANIQGDITVIVKDDGKAEFYNLEKEITKEKVEELFVNTKVNVPTNILFLKYTNQLITGTDTKNTLVGSVFGLFTSDYVGEYTQANAIKVSTSQGNGLVDFSKVYAR